MIYDVAVIGAGASGGSTAYQLSHYNVRTVLLEKCCDAGFGVSKANSGIVHGGFHHPTTSLKAKLEVESIAKFDALKAELHFPFERCGIIVCAYSDEELEVCRKLYNQGIANGISNLKWCSREEMLALEPKLNSRITGGFLAPDGGVIEPYTYVQKLVESASVNGVDCRYDFKVAHGVWADGVWTLSDSCGNEIKARYVVNAAGLYADEISRYCGAEEFTISPRKGEEYLLDRNSAAKPNHVVFPVPTKHSKGVLVIPTVGGTTMIGPTADVVDEKTDDFTTSENFSRILKLVDPMISGINARDVINSFSGLRPVILEQEDFYIAPSEKVSNFIQVAGIQSPGLTASPAIGEYVVNLLGKSGLPLEKKSAARVTLPAPVETRKLSGEELAKEHDRNPAATDWVCRCEKISEAEIIEAVRHGHTTLDGVKFYTRSGMGRCQGGFCSAKIMRIIARESGIPLQELTKRGGNSYLLAGKLGDLEVKGN